MLYFATPPSGRALDAMRAGLIGMIDTPTRRGTVPTGVVWCADNGAYGRGFPGEPEWFDWLSAHPRRSSCSFAVAPDVVGDAAATLDRSLPWLPRIRELGIPAALAAQDGLEELSVPWHSIDVLFLGGSTAWKLGPHARDLTRQAKLRGKAVHMGRVNSERRFAYAAAIGCDSADGTILAFGPDANLPRVLSMTRLADQLSLWQAP